MPSAIPAIIVVEDAPDILIVLRRVLRDLVLEYDIITVNNARSALAHATHRRCALLITDYLLDGMNGLQLARECIARYGSKVIMISAYATPELRASAHAAGIDVFIAKPFQVDDLEAAVKQLLPAPSAP